jgi:TonB family protein
MEWYEERQEMMKIVVIACALIASAPTLASGQVQIVRLAKLDEPQRTAITLSSKPLPRENCTSIIDPLERPLVHYIDQQNMQALINDAKPGAEGAYILYAVRIDPKGNVTSRRIETTMSPEEAASIDARINDGISFRGDTAGVQFRVRLDPASAEEPLRLGRAVSCPPVLLDQKKVERAIGTLSRKFPRYAKAAVIVWFRVDDKGLVRETRIRESSTDAEFDAAAAEIVKDNIHFEPAIMDGLPTEVWVQIPIVLRSR